MRRGIGKGAEEPHKNVKVFLPPKLEVRGDTVRVNTVGGRHAPQAGGPYEECDPRCLGAGAAGRELYG